MPHYEVTDLASKIPEFIKPLVIRLLKLFGMKREAKLMEFLNNTGVDSYIKGTVIKTTVCNEYQEMWRQQELDCMIMPATCLPPLKHGQCAELLPAFFYTAVMNIFDYPAGVIPNVIKITNDMVDEGYDDPRYPNDSTVQQTRDCLRGK